MPETESLAEEILRRLQANMADQSGGASWMR